MRYEIVSTSVDGEKKMKTFNCLSQIPGAVPYLHRFSNNEEFIGIDVPESESILFRSLLEGLSKLTLGPDPI